MAARIRRTASRHADLTLAGLALAAIAGAVLVATSQDELGLGEGRDARTVEVHVLGDLPASSAPFRVALEVTRARLEADPSIERVSRPAAAPGARRAILRAEVSADASAPATIERLRETVDPGILEVAYRGAAAELEAARDAVVSDLRLLLLALPAIALLAVWILGPWRAVGALIAAAAASFGAAALCLGISLAADLSALALVGAACGGLPALHRFATDPGRDREAPPVAPALAAAAVLAVPAAMDAPHLTSFALGACLAALLALPVVALAAPAAAALWGPFAAPASRLEGLRERLASLLRRRKFAAIAAACLCLGALAALAFAATGLETEPLVEGAPVPSRVPAAAAIALAAVALAGLAATRRPATAAGAALSAALAPAAAVGVGTLAFVEGGLEGVGEIAASPVSPAALVAATATVAACAALASLGGPLGATALTHLTGASLALPLAGSGEPFLQQFGLVVAAGLLADLVLIRLLLAAAVGALPAGRVLGRWRTGSGAAASPRER